MASFWNPDRVAEDLRTGRLSEREKYQYLLGSTTLHVLLGRASLSYLPHTGAAYLVLGLVLGGAAVGLRACFLANGGSAGSGFVERYTCLAVPLTLRLYATLFAISFVLNFVAQNVAFVRPGWFAVWPLVYFGGLAWYFATMKAQLARIVPRSVRAAMRESAA